MKVLKIIFVILLLLITIEVGYYLYITYLIKDNANQFSLCSKTNSCKPPPKDPLLGKDQKAWIENDVLPAYESASKNNAQKLSLLNEFTAIINDISPAKTSKGLDALKFRMVDDNGKVIMEFTTGIINFDGVHIKLYKMENKNKIVITKDELKKGQKINYRVQDDLIDRTKSTTEITVL